MGPATRYLNLEQPFAMESGDRLAGVRLAWECWGELNAARDNVILLFTGLSPGAHAAASRADPEPGWWNDMIGTGRPLDTDRFFILCVNSLGSCKGSTGPSSTSAETDRPWRLDFPELAIEDIARATQKVVEHLEIETLHAVVGPSMGGMTTLAWLNQNPGRARRVALISSAAAATPFAIAIRSLQREAIVSDRNFCNGAYTEERWPETGMRIARKLGMISYRSAAEWQERFGREPQDYFPPTTFGMRFAIESYLESHARKFVGRFDPVSYLYLSRAMDLFDATADGRDLEAVFRDAGVEQALVIGVTTDILFPVDQQRELAAAAEAAGLTTRFHELASVQGHDAFLIDFERFAPPMEAFLA